MTSSLTAFLAFQCLLATAPSPVEVSVRPAFGGRFRPGLPVAVFVEARGASAPFEGKLGLRVGGMDYSGRARVAPGGSAACEFLVPAWAARPVATLSVVTSAGHEVSTRAVELPLAKLDEPSALVAVYGQERAWAAPLCGERAVVVAARPLPRSAAGYLGLDALLVRGDGASLPPGCGVETWVRSGGQVVFVVEPERGVGEGSLAALLAGAGGGTNGSQWIQTVRKSAGAVAGAGWVAWPVGLGRAAVVLSSAAGPGVVARLLAPRKPEALADEKLYGAFHVPRWPAGVRWRLVAAPVALMVLGVLMAGAVARRRAARAAALAASGLLAAAATAALFLPGGRAVARVARVVEEDAGWRRATDVVCVDGLGRSRVELVVRGAEAVLPLSFSAGEAGKGEVERVSGDVWVVRAEVERGARRCFVALGRPSLGGAPAPEAAARERVVVRDGRFSVGGGQERPLGALRLWDGLRRALVAWQARRSRPGTTHLVAWNAEVGAELEARGVVASRRGPTLRWVGTWGRPGRGE